MESIWNLLANFLPILIQKELKAVGIDRAVVLKNRLVLAGVASVSVWFRSKERPRNGILGFGRARNETRAKKRAPFFARSLTLVPRSLLPNRTETLATQGIIVLPLARAFLA